MIYPGDWEVHEFDDVFRIISNNTLSRDKLTTRGNIGNIHYGDVLIKYGTILTAKDNIPKIKPEYESSAKIFLRKNDIIIADTAEDETVGKAIQIGDVNIPLVAGLHTIPCRPIIPTAPGYLGYYINSKEYHDQLLPYITGIKVSSISKASIKKTLIPLPLLKEQTAIAETLAAFDTHITNLTELITKKKAIRDGALDELMTGRTRLGGFCGDWEVKTLGESLKVKRGKRVVRRQLSTKGNFPVYQNSLATLGFFDRCNCETHSAFIIAAGNAGDVGFSETPFWAADDCYYFDECKNIEQKFLYYMLLHHQRYIYTQTRRTSIPRLSHDILENILISLPTLDEQIAIADTLSALDKEISSLETERAKISSIRDGAINDLLTGKVRLKK